MNRLPENRPLREQRSGDPAAQVREEEPLLRVRGLRVHFPIGEGLLGRPKATVKALGGVDLELRKGEVFGLVGESGCGKTTLGRAVVGLAPVTEGEILLPGPKHRGPFGPGGL